MTKEEALNILKELHDKAPLFEKGALETFFPEFKKDEQDKWTEEDESICKDLISYFNYQPLKHSDDLVCNWLKSLKERVHPKPQWTEKDIKMINILCSIFEVSNGYYKVDKPGQYAIRAEEILDWLKLFKRKLQ